jgi:DNA-binding NarL/FixJ family response regulator
MKSAMPLPPYAGKHSSSERPAAPAARRFIVADDSDTILHAICSLLEHHQLAEIAGRATSGKQALAMAAHVDHQYALIDADMPEMTGLTTAALMARSLPSTRVILMSMEPTAHERVAGFACGVYALISKPRFLKELAALFEREVRPSQ